MKWTVSTLVKRATEILKERKVEPARLDAELLMCHLLNFDSRVKIYTRYDRPLTNEEVENYRVLIKRRVKGEPIAYITGKKEFFGLKFKVDKNVLIPRPETEILVERTIELIKNFDTKEPIKIADVGTGSGCIIITLGKLLKIPVKLFATDISEKALEIASENARIHKIPIKFIHTNILQGVEETFKVIISNPPYIPLNDKRVDSSVEKFEPQTALYAGKDGLDIIKKLTEESYKKLKPNGLLIFEFGEGQESKVCKLLKESGYSNINIIKDLAGKDRIAYGFKQKEEKRCTNSL